MGLGDIGPTAVTLARLTDAFLLAVVGALAVAFTGAVVAFVKRRAHLEQRVDELAQRVDRLEEGKAGDGGA